MKIVHVGVNLIPSRGGIYRTVVSFTEAYENLNYNARILNFGLSTESQVEFRAPSTFIKTSSLPFLKQYHFWDGFRTNAAQEAIGVPDLVIIHGLFYYAAATVASYCRRRAIPYVVVSHGSLDPYVFTYRRIRKAAWTRIYRRKLLAQSSAVLFSTRTEAEKASKWTSDSNVRVIPWPVEYCPDYDKIRARSLLLEKYDLPSETRLALYCGRMDPVKRPLETIRAFKATAEEDWLLLVVGPPTDRLPAHIVEAVCREPGARATYVGATYGRSLVDHFQAADLLILLSQKENFSHVAVEALASGVPVFLSRGVDIWRDLAAVDCSFVPADGRDQEASTRAALARVLGMERDEHAAAGRRGRDWVRTELSPQRFAERVKGLCESVVKNSL